MLCNRRHGYASTAVGCPPTAVGYHSTAVVEPPSAELGVPHGSLFFFFFAVRDRLPFFTRLAVGYCHHV